MSNRSVCRWSLLACVLLACVLLAPWPLAAPLARAFHNGQAASLVLGQKTFTTDGIATERRMHVPQGVAVDPASGAVFVADTQNNRVLRFAAAAALTNGAAADAVFGQPDFTSRAAAAGAQGMSWPFGVALDNAGRLWVADTYNGRVLRFDNAVSKPSGAAADGVLGKPDFTSPSGTVSERSMVGPWSVAVDADGRLWVADSNNQRVLRFDNAAAKPNGAAADGVLGQPDFFTREAAPTTARSLYAPRGVAVDADGRLWVADTANHRVLRFDNAASKPNGAAADGVLGQPSFTVQPETFLSVVRLSSPVGVSVDAGGRLWVADDGSNQVLRFDAAAGKPNGAPADGLLGGTGDSTSAQTLRGASGVAVDAGGRLWVADTWNHRVLRFDNAAAKPDSAPADGLLGNRSFSSSMPLFGPDALNNPGGVAVDPATRKVFVADTLNNRVLRFASRQELTNGTAPEGVLGQPDFEGFSPSLGAQGMSIPAALELDADGRLWVADTGNNRVLRFDNAVSKPNGAPAEGVLGQPTFTDRAELTSAERMKAPRGLAIDSSGRLWVADGDNNRVLRFDNAAAKPNGAPADGLLGQRLFDGRSFGSGLSEMNSPSGLAVDDGGRLWVADSSNNRVLRFDGAAAKPGGALANGWLGVTYRYGELPKPSMQGMNGPSDVAVDERGRLWVADALNLRVLRFDDAALKPDGGLADGVLGQPDFVTLISLAPLNLPPTSARRTRYTAALALDGNDHLWVVDSWNNRVVLFDDPGPKICNPSSTLTPTPLPDTPTITATTTPTATEMPTITATTTPTATETLTSMVAAAPTASGLRIYLPALHLEECSDESR
jgi:DNA-binding beta-propeller fold protein YncE